MRPPQKSLIYFKKNLTEYSKSKATYFCPEEYLRTVKVVNHLSV